MHSRLKTGIGLSAIVLLLAVPFFARAVTFSKSSTITGGASVFGTLSKGSGTFVIDHPLNPKNWLLYHSFVESPDVKNIYDGIATLDLNGETTVVLPDYFLALNKDFRYLATPIGASMPGLYLKSGVERRFWIFGVPVLKIAGGAPNGRVSWQVTGIRHDVFIEQNPIVVEVDKGPDQIVDKGEYVCPECYAR